MSRVSVMLIALTLTVIAGAAGVYLTYRWVAINHNISWADKQASMESAETREKALRFGAQARQLSYDLALDGIFIDFYLRTGSEEYWERCVANERNFRRNLDKLDRDMAFFRKPTGSTYISFVQNISDRADYYFTLRNECPSLYNDFDAASNEIKYVNESIGQLFIDLRRVADKEMQEITKQADQYPIDPKIFFRIIERQEWAHESERAFSQSIKEVLLEIINNRPVQLDNSLRNIADGLKFNNYLKADSMLRKEQDLTKQIEDQLIQTEKIIRHTQKLQQHRQERLTGISVFRDNALEGIGSLVKWLETEAASIKTPTIGRDDRPSGVIVLSIPAGLALMSVVTVLLVGLLGRRKHNVSRTDESMASASTTLTDDMARELLIGQLRAAADTLAKLRHR